MMMKNHTLVAALALLGASAAFAQDSGEAPAPSPSGAPSQADTAEKKICHVERMTGSRIRATRICLTRAEWNRLSEGSQRNVDNLVKDANQTRAVLGSGGTDLGGN